MKFLTVVMLIFLIHISASAVNSIQYTTGYSIQPYQSWIDDVGQESLQGDEYFQSSAAQDAASNLGFGDFIKGFAIFIGTFALGVVVVPYTLVQFGLDTGLAVIFSVPVYVIYSIGLAQFISNRATKSME